MGIPAGFRWLSQKYPKIVSSVIEEHGHEVDGQAIPVDITKPNPNGEEFDNLYLDMNGIVHPCSHPDDRPAPATEEEMMLAVFEYTERVFNMVRPRKLLLIAVDGVAPRAKMNQQRSRRFRSAQEAKEKDEDNKEFLKMLKSQNGGIVSETTSLAVEKKTWDYNVITPGTPFMHLLAKSLRYWSAYKVNTDPAWEKVKIIISDATVPGEGEHKIMEFIRSQRSSPEHDPNTHHVVYGLDADLIMLGLATHEPHVRVLREDVFFQDAKGRTCRICGQKGHIADECRGIDKKKEGDFDEKERPAPQKPFIWLHVSILREYLEVELQVPSQPFRFDLERALDDWVFMCFFVGNDFLPHLPSLDIKENGIDTLIAIWRENIPLMGGYVTKDGHVDLERAQYILDGLAKQEDAIFKRRHQTEERRDANAKRRKLEEQNKNGMSRFTSSGNSRDNGTRRQSPDYGVREVNPNVSMQVPRPTPSADIPLFVPEAGDISKEAIKITHEMAINRGAIYKANLANKSAASTLKNQLAGKTKAPHGSRDVDSTGDNIEHDSVDNESSTLGKRKANNIEDPEGTEKDHRLNEAPKMPKADPAEMPPDTVRLWEDGYSDRYYEQKFQVDASDVSFRNKVAKAYVEGLAWVLLYYFQGCPSWTWYYPYHYAPFAADFVELDKLRIHFEKGTIFKPYEQLMGVLPAASSHAIPEAFRGLMSEEGSEILDFYPVEFPIDLNGKKFAWQGVALLPFIDEKRLLKAMSEKYPLLNAEENSRNEIGMDELIISDRHPLHDEVVGNIYSKRQGPSRYKLNASLSAGLMGYVEKKDHYLPQSTLLCPITEGGLPDLDEDHSLSVIYEMPRSSYIHKSMLLRGVKPPVPALDRVDIEVVKGRARNSGRSYGGAPFRGGNRHDSSISTMHHGSSRPNFSMNNNHPRFNNNRNPRYDQPPLPPPPPPGDWRFQPPPPGVIPFQPVAQLPTSYRRHSNEYGPAGQAYGYAPPFPPPGSAFPSPPPTQRYDSHSGR